MHSETITVTPIARFFPSDRWALAVLVCPVLDLASRLNSPVEEWDEPGLGPTRGTHIHT